MIKKKRIYFPLILPQMSSGLWKGLWEFCFLFRAMTVLLSCCCNANGFRFAMRRNWRRTEQLPGIPNRICQLGADESSSNSLCKDGTSLGMCRPKGMKLLTDAAMAWLLGCQRPPRSLRNCLMTGWIFSANLRVVTWESVTQEHINKLLVPEKTIRSDEVWPDIIWFAKKKMLFFS